MKEALKGALEAARAEVRDLLEWEAGLRAECGRLLEAAAVGRSESGRLEVELESERAHCAERTSAVEYSQELSCGLRRQQEGLEARVAELDGDLGAAEAQRRQQGVCLKSLQASQASSTGSARRATGQIRPWKCPPGDFRTA